MTEQPIVIRSDRLTVEIASPGSIYRRTRFDWTGFITQVTLDGLHTYCVPEDYDPGKGTGGIGLCGEFGIEKAVGYQEASPGFSFPKLGVGLLKKIDQAPYQFIRKYEIVEPFPIHIERQQNSAVFTVEPIECNGYAARTIKNIRVRDNCLEIQESLENLGSKPIATHEYYHNFIGIDRQSIGPDYQLALPYAWEPEDITRSYRPLLPGVLRYITPDFVFKGLLNQLMDNRVLQVEGFTVGFKHVPKKQFFTRTRKATLDEGPQWEIKYLPSGTAVREYDDFTPERVALWGTAHVICAEVYIDIVVTPGRICSWTRRYEFICPGFFQVY